MTHKAAPIYDVSPFAPGNAPALRETDPVRKLLELRRLEIKHQSLAEDARLQQMQLLHAHRSNPQIQEFLRVLQGRATPMTSIQQFFEQAPHAPESPAQGGKNVLTDRSRLSPKLRKLIEEKFPEATREERIRRATEKPLPTLGKKLPLEVVRYYAEDVDLEYDVF